MILLPSDEMRDLHMAHDDAAADRAGETKKRFLGRLGATGTRAPTALGPHSFRSTYHWPIEGGSALDRRQIEDHVRSRARTYDDDF